MSEPAAGMPGSPVRFDGEGVLITGAGAGLGRALARVIGRRGGRLFLVDRTDAADAAAEIRAVGGEAIGWEADLTVAGSGRDIVLRAIDAIGPLDAVALAAGFLRDRSFGNMAWEDVEAILRIHLVAPFESAHAVWPHMMERRAGRLLFFTSHAGLYGNFGQANYAAAKLGVVGLMQTLALEGARRGVRANVIAPLAATSLARGTVLAEHPDLLRPDDVAATAAFLCWSGAGISGRVVSAAGASVAVARVTEGAPTVVAVPGEATPESVARLWPTIEKTMPSGLAESGFQAAERLMEPLRQAAQDG